MSAEGAPLLADKTPKVEYRKRYDQVSWRSADTDFETEPVLANNELEGRCIPLLCTKRKRKLFALLVVVIIFLVIMILLIYLYYSKADVVYSTAPVLTDSGKIVGIVTEQKHLGKVYELNVFKGIPYAVPPVGNLRWRAPIPLSKNKSNCWVGILKAHAFGNECAQGHNEGSEDCLYLNVYSQKLNVDKKLPVIVWIHGGYLMQGSGSSALISPNMDFALQMDAVVVTINYRLNIFGFLTLKELWREKESYGNYGLMDQILALKWVNRNIQNFGGNPNSVTIIGHNAGGSSVLALLAAPKAEGLFHKAISMSAFPNIGTSYKEAAQQNREFITRTRCTNATNVKECLYSLTTADILQTMGTFNSSINFFIKQNLLDLPNKSFIDKDRLIVSDPIIVPTSPLDLPLTKKPVSILVGSMAQEIGISPVRSFDGANKWAQYKEHLDKYLSTFSPNLTNNVLQLYSDVINNAKNDTNESAEYVHETITSDVRVTCPTTRLFKSLQQTKHRVFRYIVTHTPNSPINLFDYPSRFSFHMWDKIALFNYLDVSRHYQPHENDKNFELSLRRNFKHFILYGHMEDSDWGKGLTGVFGRNGDVTVLSGYHDLQCKFWNSPENGFKPYGWYI